MYELDEGLLSPEGSPVQCARCQHVFTARPPAAPEPAGRLAQEPPPPSPAAVQPPASAETAATETAAPAPSRAKADPPAPASLEPAPSPAASPAGVSGPRKPAVYRPTPSQPTIARPAALRRDTVGAFESRLRWSHRWKWIAPAVLALAAAAGAAVFLLREGSVDDRAQKAHAHALTLALADDVQSLEQARAELDQVLLASPKVHAARADRALVDLLIAGALLEASGEKGGEPKARHDRARSLTAAAGAELDELGKASLARAEVTRARAVAAALGASRADLRKLATAAEAELPGDPWVASAEASVDIRSADHTVRDRALSDLSVLVARRPDVLRARYLLARGQALAGRHAEALTTVAALLQVNPRHEGAMGLRDATGRPPANVPIATPQGAAAASVAGGGGEKPATASRKQDSTAGEPSGAPRTDAEIGATPPSTPRRAAERPIEGPADSPADGAVEPAPVPEPPPAPRLRPAAVPEPEPVRGGG